MTLKLTLVLLVFFGAVLSAESSSENGNGTTTPDGNNVTNNVNGAVVAVTKTPLISIYNSTVAKKTGSGVCQSGNATSEGSWDTPSLVACTDTFIFNVSACFGDHELSATDTTATMRIIKTFQQSTKRCSLKMHVPSTYSLFMSFLKLPSNVTSRDWIRIRCYERRYWSSYQKIYVKDLGKKTVNVTFHGGVIFSYSSKPENHTFIEILVHFWSKQQTLEVTSLTDNTFSLTSPFFDGKHSNYPNGIDLAYFIQLPDDYVLIGVFYHFDLGPWCTDKLLFINSTNQTVEEFCETYYISKVLWFDTSITVSFITNNYQAHTGFKFLFSIVPKSYVVLNNELLDCSVPYFDTFRELVSCNMHFECEAGEDEDGCAYSDKSCKMGEVRAGKKCYKLQWPSGAVSWTNGSKRCVDEGYHGLATMPTAEDWKRFNDLMSFRTKYNYLPTFIGLSLQEYESSMPFYTNVLTWGKDKLSAFHTDLKLSFPVTRPSCVYYTRNKYIAKYYYFYKLHYSTSLIALDCSREIDALYVCESTPSTEASSGVQLLERNHTYKESNISLATCPSDELTHTFLLCDAQGPCGFEDYQQTCTAAGVEMSMFLCARGVQTIPYTFVCDHIKHCSDYSDEDFCVFLGRCKQSEFRCRNGQCVDASAECDGVYQCVDGSDENCLHVFYSIPPHVEVPFQVDMGERQGYVSLHLHDFQGCPATHFKCHEDICLPVYLRCNGVFDCPHHEDEFDCADYTCPGFYRCWGSRVCLHPAHTCDHKFQCPHSDDELLCDADCPSVCHCQGLSFKCSAIFDASNFLHLRYLDASGSNMSPLNVSHNHYLVSLQLSHCNLNTLDDMEFQNLHVLDLSHNTLRYIRMSCFRQLRHLKNLDLSNNPINVFTDEWDDSSVSSSLSSLDLSFTKIKFYSSDTLACCTKLKHLNMSSSSLYEIATDGFTSTPQLRSVDLSNSDLTVFPLDLLQGLEHLLYVSVDNYKLCCKATLPRTIHINQCHFKEDELASCHDLLHSLVHRVVLWVFAFLSLFGNAGSFVARLFMSKKGTGSGTIGSFSILVTSLSVADFFMGVYLAIIGIADSVYRERYMWKEDEWKISTACSFAGFLSVMSSEVSAFNICLITLDRFLVLCFPFSRFHFTKKVALVASAVAWLVGIVLAAIPLLPVTSHWDFYRQSGICVPLPFRSSSSFRGYSYSFSIMICLNFVLFLLIAAGQVFIYLSVRANSFTNRKTKSRDATIARRLTTIVVSDFLCWFPIGLVGLLASSGVTIPPGINVFMAIFILPFNSALNPFLYTFNIVIEHRRKAQEARLLKRLEMRYVTELSAVEDKARPRMSPSRDSVIIQLDSWLAEKLITPQDVHYCLVAFAASEYTPKELPTTEL